ncbi:hypothetical protein [Butyrivibrio sp. MC2021]|uniref:hypothetical protein n=1 Tax=Butyrivibrio sp. MC2021 TaxID=1408306 RepID=UPI00047AAD26|nr:hypothetical protein [Butyrivibrio sp. MC2021]
MIKRVFGTVTKRFALYSIFGTMLLYTGCANSQGSDENDFLEQGATVESSGAIADVPVKESRDEATSSAEYDDEEAGVEKKIAIIEDNDDVRYDTSYLVNDDESYVYRLSDPELIKKYDELYAEAFADVIDSYKEAIAWMDQDYNSNQHGTVTNLLLEDTSKKSIVKTGSVIEMDINYDLNNLGYTYVDLDCDGVFEQIFGVSSYQYNDGLPMDVYERAYALIDGKAKKILEGGARINQWLGSDGYIYEYGSGGAAYSGIWRLHFDKTGMLTDTVDLGNNGFVEDEFLGYWEGTVHILGPIEDIDEASKLPESQMDDDEWRFLNEEWESRRVEIDWLEMSDYLAQYYPDGI